VINSYSLLGALQNFLHSRGVDVEHLTADPMVRLMLDWYRVEPLSLLKDASATEALVFRYGGWSEGCATGFRFSLLRRVAQPAADGTPTEWYAGITLMFEPSGRADLPPIDIVSSQSASLDAFLAQIEASPAYRQVAQATPMSVLLESGGVR
jgi:hypothetical protein